MAVITIDSKAFKIIIDKLSFLEQTVKALALNGGHEKYIFEDQVMALTGLSKRSLLRLRQNGVLNYSTATGRKIKYLRKDVMDYLDKNSTKR